MTKLRIAMVVLFAASVPASAGSPSGGTANGLVLTIREVGQSGRIVLAVGNVSGRPLRIWKESNSWGAARWRVLRLRGQHLDTFYENPVRDFLMNRPQLIEIPPGQEVARTLELNAGNWCAFGRCTKELEQRSKEQSIDFEGGDATIVVYDVPYMPPESNDLKAWYGVIAASTTVR
jgi:hypothetical protein